MKHGLEVAGPASCERRIHRELWRNHLVRESSPFHLRRRCLLRPILVYACPLSLVRLVLNVRVCMYVGNLQFLMGLRATWVYYFGARKNSERNNQALTEILHRF